MAFYYQSKLCLGLFMSRLNVIMKENFQAQKFENLSIPCQSAIIWYMAIDGCAWDKVDLSSFTNDEDIKKSLTSLIPQYIKHYGKIEFYFGIIDVEVVKKSVMNDEDISSEFSSWHEYHNWYLSLGDMPNHPKKDKWPIILSSDDHETIHDGWHRFHSYAKNNEKHIPVIL